MKLYTIHLEMGLPIANSNNVTVKILDTNIEERLVSTDIPDIKLNRSLRILVSVNVALTLVCALLCSV